MNTSNLLREIERDGFTVELIDGNLAIRPASKLTDDLRQFIRSHKAEIVLALLSSEKILALECANDATPADASPLRTPVTDPVPDAALPILQSLGYSTRYITDDETAKSAVDDLLGSSLTLLGLDIETGGLDPIRDLTRCLQVADDSTAYVFDLHHIKATTLEPLMRGGKMFVAYNAVFEWRFLHRLGLQPLSPLHDSMLMARTCYGLNLEGGYFSLADTAKRVLGLSIDKAVRQSDWMSPGPLIPEQVHYAALDAVLAVRLVDPLYKTLKETKQTKPYRLQIAALPTVASHMLEGVPFDGEGHSRLITEWGNKAVEAKEALERIMPGVNPNSSVQLANWLKQSLPAYFVETWPRTDTGNLKTDAAALSSWSGAPPELQAYKEYSKLLSTYGEKYKNHIHPDTGRIHANFSIAGTVGGRFKCSKPNLQNPPRLAAFRQLFRPERAGYRLIVADYSQIELRIAALIAEDQTMLDAYRNGVDLHRLTASITCGIPLEAVTKDQRQAAKAINFGLIYGMQPPGLQAYAKATYGIEMTLQDAENSHRKFFETYAGIRRWHQRTRSRGYNDQTVRTTSGLVRNMRNEAGGWKLTNALNTPVQGSGAEVLLKALEKLPEALSGLDCRVIHHVHDEIILECAEHNVKAGKGILQSVMISAFEELFPTSGMTASGDLVEAHDGVSWEEAKS
ncbi:MAG: hypothetical protein EBT06_10505 [Gammaproteobacteria bacterium]|nr:hypothetical protein [Gammaproteobacteria bacterium]NBT45328.1 hypothetical protein [Gammaproteobacteria bacterium]NBY21626.1 hypothetical protein [Gammaproteobacteria bacterium]